MSEKGRERTVLAVDGIHDRNGDNSELGHWATVQHRTRRFTKCDWSRGCGAKGAEIKAEPGIWYVRRVATGWAYVSFRVNCCKIISCVLFGRGGGLNGAFRLNLREFFYLFLKRQLCTQRPPSYHPYLTLPKHCPL